MQHVQYLVLLALCLLVTLPLEVFLRAQVYRRTRRTVLVLTVLVLVFGLWDLLAVLAGWWSYNPEKTTGLVLFQVLPLEELCFFVVVPLCGLLAFEGVGAVLAQVPRRRQSGAQDG